MANDLPPAPWLATNNSDLPPAPWLTAAASPPPPAPEPHPDAPPAPWLEPKPSNELGPMPGALDALVEGAKHSIGAVHQSAEAMHGDKPTPMAPDTSPAAQDFGWQDLAQPFARGLPKLAYGIGQSSPTLAGGLLGGAAGSLVAPGAGTAVGGAGGAAAGAALQTLGPAFAAELQKNPQDPDGAWTRARESAAASGAFSAASWALFPAKFFEGPVKNLAFQVFGVQAPLGVGEKATQNVITGDDATKDLGRAYVQSAIGTAVPAIGHLALANRKGKPEIREVEPTPQEINASVNEKVQRANDFITQAQAPGISAGMSKTFLDKAAELRDAATVELDRTNAKPRMESNLQYADMLEQQSKQPGLSPLQAQDLRNSAFELRRDADHEGLIANLAPPLPMPENTMVARAKQTYFKDIQPELTSDWALNADPTLARYVSRKAQSTDALQHSSEARKFKWRKFSDDEQLRFLQAAELGLPVPTDIIQKGTKVGVDMGQTLQMYRDLTNADYRLEVQYGSKAHFVDNYWQHAWKDVGKAHQLFNSQRMIESMGQANFQKMRTYNLIEMGRQAGLELVTNNPEEIWQNRRIASVDMINKMKLLHELERQGVATPEKSAPPQVKNALINPKTQAWQPVTSPTGEQWFIAPDVATMWQTAVENKGSLWANQTLGGSVFRKWMDLKNAWVPVKLAASAFHPVHVLHINGVDNMRRAMTETFGAGQQGMLRRIVALPEAALQTIADTGSLFSSPFSHWFNNSPGAGGSLGKAMRTAWLTTPENRTAQQNAYVKLANDAGVALNRSVEMRTLAKDQLNRALAEGRYPAAIYPAVKRAMEVLTSPVFEEWIPNLKAAALARESEMLFRRRPDLLTNPGQRALALRTIGKQIDSRFGEMFYGSLFWNRTLKDASVASFLSLGWNLGFVREFGGGFFEPMVRRMMEAPSPSRKLIRDVQSKTSNMITYSITAMMINAIMNKAMSGDNPQDWMDLIFPRIGGLNPDGSPRRVTNAFYTREVPMAKKNIDERQSVASGLFQMMYHKMMFAPLVEMANNKDYFGNQIMDETKPGYIQAKQFITHLLGEDLQPMSISGAQRSLELSGKPHTWQDVFKGTMKGDFDAYGALLGFGPAPAYASKSPLQNRIDYIFRETVQPNTRSASVAEISKAKSDARTEYLGAKQRNDTVALQKAAEKLASLGVKTAEIRKLQPGISSYYKFSRFAPEDKKSLLFQMTPAEFKEYFPYIKSPAVLKDKNVRALVQKYYSTTP